MGLRGTLACALILFLFRVGGAPTPVPAPDSPPQEAPPPASDDTPWGKGVSAERKAAAEQLLGEGNALFVQNRFPEAAERVSICSETESSAARANRRPDSLASPEDRGKLLA